MGFLERLGFERPSNISQEASGSIEDVNELLRLAERNHDVQVVLNTYGEKIRDMAANVMVGDGTSTAQDRALMDGYLTTAVKSLQELGYDVSPEVIDQSL